MRDDTTASRTGRLTAALSTIATLEAVTHEVVRAAGGERPSGKPGSRPPMPIGLVSIQREALDSLTGWALLVIEERDLDTRLVADTAGNLATWLLQHAEWLAGHEAGRDAADEIDGIAQHYGHVVRPTGRRRFALEAKCPGQEPSAPCGGQLNAELQGTEDQAASIIVCQQNRAHQWAFDQWDQFAPSEEPLPTPAATTSRDVRVRRIVKRWASVLAVQR